MAQFKSINTLQIGNHLWVFTDPQIIEWKRDENENSVTMRATVHIHHEEHLTGVSMKSKRLTPPPGA